MRKELLDILVCPMCKQPLTLAVESEDQDEVVSGTLTCSGCGETYPIVDRIPNLLPPELREPASSA
ncbi:MAG TPA: methytransferase partner Trm112 [Dehalococcoidia bacterium]|nr:methytransferase partner Trm112 [Dehalococcoidia bacterium]